MTQTDNVLVSVQSFPDQLLQAWHEVNEISLPADYSNFLNVVLAGMGGSALGGRVVKWLTYSDVKVPFEVSTQINVPGYVGEQTLVIASSYSGNTEETIASLSAAQDKNAKVFVTSTGGSLAEYVNKYNVPSYIYDPIHNPAGQPRMATGYSIGSILALLSRLHLISISADDFQRAVEFIRHLTSAHEDAKMLADQIYGKIPIFIASEHLIGATHILQNQINETAKSFASLYDLPEINHHLMEGLSNPTDGVNKLKFLFIESDYYSDRIKARYPLTKEVVEKNNVDTYSFKLTGYDKLSQALELIQVGSYLQLDLGGLYGADPTSIPWVDYFKEKLA